MKIPNQVRKEINEYFPERKLAEVWEVLSQYGAEANEKGDVRVYRAILKLSKGNFEDLIYYTKAAKTDYRDVIFWSNEDK